MKIAAIKTCLLTLPFRFSFGHSLAKRAESTNLIVKVTLDDGTVGYGEGVPRQYVTGEDGQTAAANVENIYGRRFIGLDLSDAAKLDTAIFGSFIELGLERRPQGASWCALELAILDAAGKAQQKSVASLKGPLAQSRIRYGGVLPFAGKKALLALLMFYKIYGFQTIKIKVGKDLASDLAAVAMSRRIMGPQATIRVDANCAWTVDQTLRAAEAMAPYQVASIEQPVAADQWQDLQVITKQVEQEIVVDESLCTLEQARQLAEQRICTAFNIRLSKVGGFLVSQEMVRIAQANGLGVHLGAQVGESGILSAAARIFGCLNPPFENYEGSMNLFLLQKDLTRENLTAGLGGFGDLSYAKQKYGLAVEIDESLTSHWQLSTIIAERPASSKLASSELGIL